MGVLEYMYWMSTQGASIITIPAVYIFAFSPFILVGIILLVIATFHTIS